jgi:indole-3-pyruvate monooxygenase
MVESIKECAMTRSEPEKQPQTLILGAGPAGLAMGACLREGGSSFEILERGEAVGNSWRNHYERLHLHTTKRHSALPGLPFPSDYPTFPSRQQVVDYLDSYATRFSLAPRFGENVTSVRRSGDGYEVESNGRLLRATNIVMATGYNRTPLRPSWPGLSEYAGVVVHSRDYRRGETFRGKRVLVIGMGNTGGEIGLDLLEHGARPSISVRSPIIALPRDFLGRPTQITAIVTRGLPRKVRDFLGTCVSRLVFGDLSGYGFGHPKYGPMTSIEVHRRIPLLDVGMVARVKDGSMPLRPDVTRFTPTGVVFADERVEDFDAVVMATGYRTGLDELLAIPGLLDASGYPLKDHDPERAPGLHFIGFANVATGLLREIGIQARAIARELSLSRT